MSLHRKFLILFAVIAALASLTGCKSRQSASGGGQTYDPRRDRLTLEDCLREIDDPMARALISEAGGWLGTRYVYGGASKQGTDCSGLVMSVFNNVCELKIPRTTRDQVRYCTPVARNKMRPGDLVFFAPGKKEDKVSHVGLYIGQGRMIHASSSRGVMVSGFDSGYWGDRYFTGARVDGAPRAYAALNRGKGGKISLPPAPSLPPVPEDLTASAPVPAPASAGIPDAAPAESSASGVLPAAVSIDLLDLLINEKVDSIFSSNFND